MARVKKRRGCLWRVIQICVGVVLLFVGGLAALRLINPPTTMVQVQRRIGALVNGRSYTKQQTFVPLGRISPDLQHAVIAAEDARFYQHSGIDWKEVEDAIDDTRETGEPPRGASTITQQLVKNLFFTTHRSYIRKAVEYPLASLATFLLGRQRVLELYLNVAEWGPGVYGAEAAAQYHYGTSAARLTREQAARLAAILPSPLRRKPARMNHYSQSILTRMRQMGW